MQKAIEGGRSSEVRGCGWSRGCTTLAGGSELRAGVCITHLCLLAQGAAQTALSSLRSVWAVECVSPTAPSPLQRAPWVSDW